jgi:predicted HAD superfamily Cof-like phosphohydrolase
VGVLVVLIVVGVNVLKLLYMKEINALNSVKKFHEKFDHLIADKPSIPNETICNLRVNLLREEVNEFETALKNGDLVEAADALLDIQYVLSGAMLSIGIHEIASELFDEVQRSNMSKLCKNMDEVNATIKHYTEVKGFNCSFEKKGEYFHVFRIEDKKTLKSVAYSPVSLKPIIEKALDPRACHDNHVCYPVKGKYDNCEGCPLYY